MATKVRQIVPMASPDTAFYSGMIHVVDDAEAERLAKAGLAEIVARKVNDREIGTSDPGPIPEGAMASRNTTRSAPPQEKGNGKPTVTAAHGAGNDPDAGAEA